MQEDWIAAVEKETGRPAETFTFIEFMCQLERIITRQEAEAKAMEKLKNKHRK